MAWVGCVVWLSHRWHGSLSNDLLHTVRLLQVPFSFHLSLLDPPADSVSPASRRLLDIEKMTLATDADGRVMRDGLSATHAEAQTTVQLTVSWAGRAPSAAAEAALLLAGVEYVIVCDTLLAPGVPHFVPTLLGLLALLLLLAIVYAVPLIIRHASAVEAEAQSELSKQR